MILNISEFKKLLPLESKALLSIFELQFNQIRVIHSVIRLTQSLKKLSIDLESESLIFLDLNKILTELFSSYKLFLKVRLTTQLLSLSQIKSTHQAILKSHSTVELSLDLSEKQAQKRLKWQSIKEQIRQIKKYRKIRVSSILNDRSLQIL